MIFQDPMSSLNPVTTVEKQIAEVLTTHTELGRGQARARAHELLEQVGMPDAGRRLDAYPHQLSGGMCQRVMIAMAIACSPSVLIADEPTTALDVTVQAQVLALLKNLQADAGMAMIFITHDLGVVAETADRVVVMYAGRKVEEAPVDDAVRDAAAPLHGRPDRRDAGARRGPCRAPGRHSRHGAAAQRPAAGLRLRAALPAGDGALPARAAAAHPSRRPAAWSPASPPRRADMSLLALHDVHVSFNTAGGVVRAVSGVSLELAVGETLGLVGESGCGKSTLGKAILKLVPIAGGEIVVDGVDIAPLGRAAARRDAPQGADDLPGPLRLAQSALDGRPLGRPAAGHRRLEGRRHRRAGRDLAGLGRPAGRRQAALSARILRRPAPAHRHRPRAGARAPSSSSATSRCRRSTSRCAPR